jgi:hypothetical protein
MVSDFNLNVTTKLQLYINLDGLVPSFSWKICLFSQLATAVLLFVLWANPTKQWNFYE